MAGLTMPGKWKAVCAWAAVTDWELLYNEAPKIFQYVLRQYLGQNRRRWLERSPVTHAHKLTGRLLILHGTTDSRGLLSQPARMLEALRNGGFIEGRDFEVLLLGQEGHGSTSNQQRLRAYRAVVSHFERALLKGDGNAQEV